MCWISGLVLNCVVMLCLTYLAMVYFASFSLFCLFFYCCCLWWQIKLCVCMYKRRRMSVCMSVRPSVTSRYHVKTNAHSPDTLNFETNCPIINPRKPPPCEGFKRDMGWVKKRQKWKFSTDKLCLGNSYNRRLIGSPIGTNFDDLEWLWRPTRTTLHHTAFFGARCV